MVLDKSQKKMDPTEESFVAQVREASVAQVTHVKPFLLHPACEPSCETAREDRHFYGNEDL